MSPSASLPISPSLPVHSARAPAASHFAVEDDLPEKADKEEKTKKKMSKRGKGKKGEAAVMQEPLVKFDDVPVDETDKKKGVTDIRDLQLFEPADSSLTWESAFARVLPDDVYGAYSKLLGLTRQLNAGVVPFTEFVLIGFSGSGKSSLIEILLGQPFNVVGSGSTKRPIFFQWVNNRSAKGVRVTVKRDPSVADFDRDTEVTLSNLESELRKRFGTDSENPVFVTFEMPDTLNFTVIDTPGVGQTGAIDATVLALARSPNRQIIAVQRAVAEPENPLLAYLADIDPDLTRSTIVYSNLFDVLKIIQVPEALGRFVSRTPENSHRFFTSMPFFSARQNLSSASEYREIVFKMYHRDLLSLEKLQFDKTLFDSVGVLALRSWMNDLVWREFQKFVPSLLQTAKERQLSLQDDLKTVRQQADSFKGSKLRSLASNYTTEFLQCISSLLGGTAEGNAILSGETLEEEKKAHGDGAWRASNNLPLPIKDSDLNVPLAGSKLYGGQQLERLLTEFMAVSNRTEIAEPSQADVANAAGVNKLNNTTDVTWAASDLAQHKSRDAFLPLIRQLGSRAVYVMKRMGDISRRIMENRRRSAASWNGDSDVEDVDDVTRYVSFRHFVRDVYDNFIEQQAQVMVQKCIEEFYSTRTIHYSLSEEAATQAGEYDNNQPDEVKRAVYVMSKFIFGKLRVRIAKNSVLKVYNFLLVPMQTALWSTLQAAVSSLSDADLQKKFEVTATVQKLQSAERTILEKIENVKNLQADVQRASTQLTEVY